MILYDINKKLDNIKNTNIMELERKSQRNTQYFCMKFVYKNIGIIENISKSKSSVEECVCLILPYLQVVFKSLYSNDIFTHKYNAKI